MSYLEELLPEFRKGAKIRCNNWEKDKYIQKKGSLVATDNDFLCSLSVSDIFSNRWELYKNPEPEWDYVIKNKCLCWFWDNDEEVIGKAGILSEVKSREEYPFIKIFNGIKFAYEHCRPVRRDEVTFYEDKKDEEA